MIELLDTLLCHLLAAQVPNLAKERVRFEAPDAAWRQAIVKTFQDPVIDAYLVDVRENRKLRSTERRRELNGGLVTEQPAPTRLDCHYLITVWSPTDYALNLEPILDEHAMLSDAADVLFRNAPLNPALVYPAGSAELGEWAEFQDADLPTVVAPPEGFAKLSDFWSGMGQDARWKPALYLIVTLPFAMPRTTAGPMVTTRIATWQHRGRPETAEVLMQIGGHVVDAVDAEPVAGAWVRIETTTGVPLATTRTNERGRFTFIKLRADRYQLRVRASGFHEKTREDVDVPSPSGEYDVPIQPV